MNTYILVLLLTPDREKVLLKDVDGQFVPLYIAGKEEQVAGEIAFEAIKAAGVTGVKRLPTYPNS